MTSDRIDMLPKRDPSEPGSWAVTLETVRRWLRRARWRRYGGIALLVLVALWLASGIYTVDSQERGIVLRFGRVGWI